MNRSRLQRSRDRVLETPAVERLRACLPEIPTQNTYLVGGALRDSLLDRPVLDFDFVVSGDACALALVLSRKLQARYVPLDEQWGVARLIWRPDNSKSSAPVILDFASLQGVSIQEDLLQRDFTCNAMALNLTPSDRDAESSWLDPTGGLKDLEAGRIRMVRPEGFKKDPVRILRAFRLAASLRFEIDETTLKAMKEEREGIGRSAAERLGDELFKFLSFGETYEFLITMDRCGILTTLFPEMKGLKSLEQGTYHHLDAWGHTLETYRFMELGLDQGFHALEHWEEALRNWIREQKHAVILLKMAALFHDMGKPFTRTVGKDGTIHFYGHSRIGADKAGRILRRIRASRLDQERVRTWVRYHMGPLNLLMAMEKGHLTERAKIRFLRRLGHDAVGVLLLSAADFRATAGRGLSEGLRKSFEELLDSLFLLYLDRDAASLRTQPLLTGNDLMEALNLPPGPLIGRLLGLLEEARIQGRIRNRKEALERAGVLLKKLTAGNPSPGRDKG